ncbi:HlyD family secretion protein [Flavobacteriaceae bacterium]|mgnify:FL=1|nr:HlyD family secretion protein [Flavobacteriaceae bacterium]MDB4228013.1 HlyD family secretion protein [Flavobacteriaceae bacterium]MDB4237189.1 HlyD family secretion protein [Flavobacteriaceae bacterium]MDB9759931.1 HlyD family secretion protein [bacterium]MDB9780317.1 HlyD family secretion protein [Flavobacteriaceae bacterium]
MRKLILAILGVLFITGAIYGAKMIINSKSKIRKAPSKVIKTVFVDTVKNTSIPIIIPANGNLVAKRRVEIYSEVQGIFKPGSKLFKPGEKYQKNEAFISINDTEYYANVQLAKSNLYNSIAAVLADLRLDFPEVFLKWEAYLKSYDLNKPTPKLPKMVSEKENYFITGRSIVSNYYTVKNLEQRLSKYTISAPFKGILTEALVTEGTLIRSNQKLGEFIDPSVYEMEVSLSKTFASLLDVGETVELNNLEHTKKYSGIVSRVNGSINSATQTIAVYIEIKNSSLKEGMYLEANLNAKKEKNAIEINRGLLLDENKIFIIRDSVLDMIDVKPVYFSDTKVVLKDIPDGTIILSSPFPGAYVGMIVKPLQVQKENTPLKSNKTK